MQSEFLAANRRSQLTMITVLLDLVLDLVFIVLL